MAETQEAGDSCAESAGAYAHKEKSIGQFANYLLTIEGNVL